MNETGQSFQSCTLTFTAIGGSLDHYTLGTRWLNLIVMSIAIRIMGLLLVAVAVQFMLNAIKAFRLESIALVTS